MQKDLNILSNSKGTHNSPNNMQTTPQNSNNQTKKTPIRFKNFHPPQNIDKMYNKMNQKEENKQGLSSGMEDATVSDNSLEPDRSYSSNSLSESPTLFISRSKVLEMRSKHKRKSVIISIRKENERITGVEGVESSPRRVGKRVPMERIFEVRRVKRRKMENKSKSMSGEEQIFEQICQTSSYPIENVEGNPIESKLKGEEESAWEYIYPVATEAPQRRLPQDLDGINIDLMFPQLCIYLKEFYMQAEISGYKKCECFYCEKLYAKFMIRKHREAYDFTKLHKLYFEDFLSNFPVQTFNGKIINLFPIY